MTGSAAMKIDGRSDPGILKRLSVVRLDTMLPVPDIVWADDDEGKYGTWKRSGQYNEIEIDAAGEPVINEHDTGKNSIRIVRT